MESESSLALRDNAFAIYQAGVAAADPYLAVKNCLSASARHLAIRLDIGDPSKQRLGKWPKIHLIAFGKAASAMAKATEEMIPESLWAGKGIAVTYYENVATLDHTEVFGAGHPLPDVAGYKAAQRLAEKASRAQAGELVLTLVSGGGSALIPCPVDAISLPEKCEVTRLLLASGADINEINCVRKHLSQLKGGGLAKLASPADLHALILSDVLGDDLSAIASGPTVPDPSTFHEAIRILQNRQLWQQVPVSVRDHLQNGASGNAPETPKPNDPIFEKTGHTLIGSNTISLNAAAQMAKHLGYEPVIYSDHLCGIARETAEHWANTLADFQKIHQPMAFLAGGETTVKLAGNGLGGRNQEMALAFALFEERKKLDADWVFLSAGTDGRDGPTDAAGGRVDAGSLTRMRSQGIDPIALLSINDSYHALQASGDLLITGATGTNVADLQILLIHPKT
ncbi:glycerate kinase [Methylomicrobium sp. Wu6]|uniref:glycerate kinase type-2 family protein n=1 Tax=Methylomicrobium sp. Wu6 TaxID=3107928 RepID=UPI002DD6452C|nr:glycerate kinase [Methylomicrobium sp. Wu6]MEC4750493.1 glycerate kinase [Methylomicrobium sp. Wu6]